MVLSLKSTPKEFQQFAGGCPSPALNDERLNENIDEKQPRKKKNAADAEKSRSTLFNLTP